MKHFHLPTLLTHIFLPLLAHLTINDYPDFFLGLSLFLLTVHLIWAIRSKRSFLLPSCMGMCLYFLACSLGFVETGRGIPGLGSGFAWFFYGIALAIFTALQGILYLVFRSKSR